MSHKCMVCLDRDADLELREVPGNTPFHVCEDCYAEFLSPRDEEE